MSIEKETKVSVKVFADLNHVDSFDVVIPIADDDDGHGPVVHLLSGVLKGTMDDFIAEDEIESLVFFITTTDEVKITQVSLQVLVNVNLIHVSFTKSRGTAVRADFDLSSVSEEVPLPLPFSTSTVESWDKKVNEVLMKDFQNRGLQSDQINEPSEELFVVTHD